MSDQKLDIAVFAGGCFWCTEAVFQRLGGVSQVISGYTGGRVEKPTYDEITTGNTGHAEAIKILFDSEIITYRELLDVFFTTHDPTTLNQQGADKGSQYRSAIFYTDEQQKNTADQLILEFTDTKIFSTPIVTEIKELDIFYKAEEYHQNYYNQNTDQGYCQMVIKQKLNKLQSYHQEKIKN